MQSGLRAWSRWTAGPPSEIRQWRLGARLVGNKNWNGLMRDGAVGPEGGFLAPEMVLRKAAAWYLTRVTVCEAAIQGPGRTGDWAKPASGLVTGSAVPLIPQLTPGLGVWTAGPTGPVPGPVTVPGREGARLFSWNRSAHGNCKLDNPKTSTP